MTSAGLKIVTPRGGVSSEIDAGLLPPPVLIRCLGGLDFSIGGAPLSFGRKAPRRLLALIIHLVAAGPATISASRLADCFWPDSDGDAALNALSTALHRVRRLLGDPCAVSTTAGNVSLNARAVAVDAWRFEATLDNGARSGLFKVDLDGELQRLVAASALYRGPFLGAGEIGAEFDPLVHEYRRRIDRKYAFAIRRLADQLVASGRNEEAGAVLRLGLAAPDAADACAAALEVLYRAPLRNVRASLEISAPPAIGNPSVRCA